MTKNSPLLNERTKARGHGAAGSGTDHWVAQRITAIALVPLTFWFLSQAFEFRGFSYKDMAFWFSKGWNLAGILAFFTAALYHGFLGVQVIIEDYIPNKGYRHICLVILKLSCCWLFMLGFSLALKIMTLT